MDTSVFPAIKPVTLQQEFTSLSEDEIDEFVSELNPNEQGNISLRCLERKLEEVLEGLDPEIREHYFHHVKHHINDDLEKERVAQRNQDNSLQVFLHNLLLLPHYADFIPKDDLKQQVRSWNVPSQKQNVAEEDDNVTRYSQNLTFGRRVRAYWSLNGPRVAFLTLVTASILSFGIWQLMEYATNTEARVLLGWGVLVAKGFAGAIYPTLFILILSMSRWFAKICRNFYHLSRFVNWDRHQSFHTRIALVGLFFANMHAIGHFAGDFLNASRHARKIHSAAATGVEALPRPYIEFVRSLPGITGMIALGLYWAIVLLSLPHVRRRSYELFQLGHLLMFPMIGFLCAHGAKKMLQFPMLGFWLAFPAGLATLERLHRVYCGFITVPAFWNVLDDDTVVMTCKRPHARPWHYSAGQYILLQVPAVSFFQWHPFTISHCEGDLLQLHIKTDGNWTSKLRELPFDIQVGIDGPFGAPAQRFYEYNRSLIIGAGVGITPFSAIISDLEQHIYEKDGWSRRQSRHIHGSLSLSRRTSRKSSRADSASSGWDNNDGMISVGPGPLPLIEVPSARRVDFHWLVREKNSLLWFSDLLDSANDMSKILPPGYLDLNIYTHITTKQDNLSTYIFQYLLDAYRTETYPVSTITGLKMRSRFGRPDFKSILENFNDDVKRQIEQGHIQKGEKIAVFFCGPPAIGTILSDMCYELTLRGKADSTNIRWDFRMEVFG